MAASLFAGLRNVGAECRCRAGQDGDDVLNDDLAADFQRWYPDFTRAMGSPELVGPGSPLGFRGTSQHLTEEVV